MRQLNHGQEHLRGGNYAKKYLHKSVQRAHGDFKLEHS